MNIRLLASTALLQLAIMPALAQNGNIYLEDSSIKVVQYGAPRRLAWSGGFNAPQFATADLNKDGLKDLVVYEWKERVVRTFINRGTSTVANYVYAPKYAKAFPLCYDYVKLEDYNRDGIADLIERGGQGFAIYRGYFNNANELNFEFYRNLRYDSPIFRNVNAYTQPSDIPGIVDVDGDGDLDFFGFDVNGGLISFYKNCQVELGLPKDTIRVCNPSNCWGHVFQSFERTYTLGIVPALNSPTCNTLGTFGCKLVGTENMLKDTRHSGNCMLMLDFDGDGDVDLLDGNISFPDLQYLRNGRSQYGGTDSIVGQDTLWQAGGRQVYLPNWPSATYADADGDGKKDILISPHDFGSAENYRCVMLYRNTGTATSPVFSYQTDTFLIDRTIDVGTASYPVLYDYNKDGRPDLFVGSDGYYQPGGNLRSRISYYQNSVSGGVTTLTLQTTDFNGLFAEGFTGAAPAFGDIDGDGKDDMLIGHSDGTISYYKNTASSGVAQPQWTLAQLKLKNAVGDSIDVGFSASPYIYDINKDGKPDLLIGNQSGRIRYYQGAAAGGVPVLTYKTDTLGGVKANSNNTFSGFSSIWIGKMDVTGKDFLLTGNDLGNVVRYTGFQNGNVSTAYSRVSDTYSDIDAGTRSTVTAGDIDGDGRVEMIVGNSLGGLYLYKQGPVVSVPGTVGAGNAGCKAYPNPAGSSMTVSWDEEFTTGNDPVRIDIVNMLGQAVISTNQTVSAGSANISVAGLPAGIYNCIVHSGSRRATLRVSIIH